MARSASVRVSVPTDERSAYRRERRSCEYVPDILRQTHKSDRLATPLVAVTDGPMGSGETQA